MKIDTILNEIAGDDKIIVKGVGEYQLKQVEANVKRKISEIAKTAASATDSADWNRIHHMLTHSAMLEMVKSIANAHKQD